MKNQLWRLLILASTILLLIVVYAVNLSTPVVITAGEATVQYHATPVLVPEQVSTMTWKADRIGAIYLNEEGIVGEGSQDFVVNLCETNRYPLDVTLQNDETLSLQIEPNILLFDPLFVGLLLVLIFQILMFTRFLRRLTPAEDSLRWGLVPIPCIIFLSYLLVPIAEVSIRALTCV